MKTTIIILLLALSLLANGLLWRRVNVIEHERAAGAADYPLGEMMGYMQRYADKLWFAGEAGNWNLANFYAGEIAETAEDISRAGVVKDGIEVSKLLGAALAPGLESMGQAVRSRDQEQFRERYRTMIASCNACHEAAKHAFIQVTVPAGPPSHWNQAFTPPAPTAKP